MVYLIRMSQIFAKIFQRIFALYNIQILFWEEWTKEYTFGWS